MADVAVQTEPRRRLRKADPPVLRRLGPLIALLGMCAILTALSDHFLTFDNLMNVFRQSAVNALLALGQLLVIVTAGIDLSVGSILGLACVVAALMMKAGLPGWLSGLAAVSVAIRPRRDQRPAAHPAAIASSIHSHSGHDECGERARPGDFRRVSRSRICRPVFAGWAPVGSPTFPPR